MSKDKCTNGYYLHLIIPQESDIEESSNLKQPNTPSISDMDDGEEVVHIYSLYIYLIPI